MAATPELFAVPLLSINLECWLAESGVLREEIGRTKGYRQRALDRRRKRSGGVPIKADGAHDESLSGTDLCLKDNETVGTTNKSEGLRDGRCIVIGGVKS